MDFLLGATPHRERERETGRLCPGAAAAGSGSQGAVFQLLCCHFFCDADVMVVHPGVQEKKTNCCCCLVVIQLIRPSGSPTLSCFQIRRLVLTRKVKLEAAPLKTTDFGFEDYLQSAVPRPACRVEAQPNGRLQDRQSITMSDFWHKMGCCVVAKPPPKKKRRKIDRSMIGEPTNFIHLTHIGSGEMAEGLQPSGPVQEQMRSKGPNTNVRNSLL
uniref:CDC42 small effector 1 n=1 Tax=Oryzias latipes TaxID=8090 RepID=A0A3P9KQ11_ORYLA